MKIDKVIIELPEIVEEKEKDKTDAFIESLNTFKEKPCSNNIEFKHKLFPELTKSKTLLNWDSVHQKLTLSITENSSFDVQRWIEHTNKQCEESKKSPFSSPHLNFITIIIKDGGNKKIAELVFRNLSITSHNCSLSNHEEIESPLMHNCSLSNHKEVESPLIHVLTIDYEHQEFKIENENSWTDIREETDEEWKKDSSGVLD